MEDVWALALRDRCRESGVAFHFKQHSAFRSGTDPLLQGIEYRESPLVQIATNKEAL
jgi:protein gp37